MAKARKASVTQAKIGMMVYGEPFTGKSTMLMQFAFFKRPDGKPFRVLYLDPESGSIDDYLGDLQEQGVNLENIYIVYTQSLGEVRQYISKVKNNEDFYELDDDGNETDDIVKDADGEPFRADAIVVDGTTILNLTTKQGLVEFSKKRNKVKADRDGLIGDERLVKVEGAGMELKDYQTVNFKGQDLILDLMACGVHYGVSAREKEEQVSKMTSDGKKEMVGTGRYLPDGFKGMEYNVKTVLRMFRDADTGMVCAHVDKDRAHVHEDNQILEDPQLTDWQVVVDKTKDAQHFTLKNDLTHSVDTEKELYQREILGEVGKPAEMDAQNENAVDEEKTLKEQIMNTLKSLNAPDKTKKKKELTDKGLPTAFKTVTDVEILKKVLEVVSA